MILEPQRATAPPVGPERDPSASEALYARTHRSLACLQPATVEPWLKQPSVGPLKRMGGAAREAILAFYKARDYRQAWACADGSLQRAVAIGDAFADAWRHGLEPSYYFNDRMRSLLAVKSREALAEVDVHLTAALLLYASHVVRGRRVPDRQQAEGFLPGALSDRAAMLERLAVAPDLRAEIASLMPANPAYQRMRRTLALYRGIARNAGWPRVPAGEGMLRPGDRDPRVVPLRVRLKVSGDVDAVAGLPLTALDAAKVDAGVEAAEPANATQANAAIPDRTVDSTPADPLVYDRRLELAVRHFQRRHGLTEDGIVGPDTLDQLNVTVAGRVDQLVLNMERMRWRTTRPDHRIEVNIPAFRLAVVIEGRERLSMKAIVGRTSRQTPLIAGRLRYLVLNPYWHVPNLIARKDIARAMVQDPSYAGTRGIQVLTGWGDGSHFVDPATVDWAAARHGRFPYRLRQDPGPRNSLGRIKFMMPNPHAIYLHDTPDRHLFDRDRRSFSSGCVRVEDPMALAVHLLQGSRGGAWDAERIARAIGTGRRQSVALPRSVPVYLDYVTAWVAEDGHTVQFRDDLYDRDHRLATVLAEATPAPKPTQLSAR